MNTNNRVAELHVSNFITCPWLKSICPTKINLPKKLHFSYFLKKTNAVGTH